MVVGLVNSVARWRYNSTIWRVCSASCFKKRYESYHPHRRSPRLGDEVVNRWCAACFNNRAARSLLAGGATRATAGRDVDRPSDTELRHCTAERTLDGERQFAAPAARALVRRVAGHF